MVREDFNLDLDLYLNRRKRHDKLVSSGFSWPAWQKKKPVKKVVEQVYVPEEYGRKEAPEVKKKTLFPNLLRLRDEQAAKEEASMKEELDTLEKQRPAQESAEVVLPDQPEYKSMKKKRGFFSKFSLGAIGKQRGAEEEDALLPESGNEIKSIPPMPPSEGHTGARRMQSATGQGMEEHRKSLLDVEIEEIIKSLLKVNMSILQRFTPTQIQRFKQSEDYLSFKRAVDKYKRLHG